MAAKKGTTPQAPPKKCAVCGHDKNPATAAFCVSCGSPLSGVAKGVTYVLEANAVGTNGSYTIEARAAKNGEGISNAEIAIVRSSDGSETIVTANTSGRASARFDVVGKWEGFHVSHQQADKWLWLSGPRYQRPDADFACEFRSVVAHHRGVNGVPYFVILAIILLLLVLKGGMVMVGILGSALGILAGAAVVFIAGVVFADWMGWMRNGNGLLGYIAGQFVSNNNYRWLITASLLAILVAQATFAGPGAPILGQGIDQLYTDAAEWSGEKYAPDQSKYQGYASWWWVGTALLWFCFFLVHTVIAFSDEVTELVRGAANRAKNRKVAKSEHKADGETKKSGGWTFGKDFMSDILAEGVWELPKMIAAGFRR